MQILVEVVDDDTPSQTGTGLITVRVERDLNNPTLNLPDVRLLEEDVDLETFVFDVDMTDIDLRVSTLHISPERQKNCCLKLCILTLFT